MLLGLLLVVPLHLAALRGTISLDFATSVHYYPKEEECISSLLTTLCY